jgi:formiminoglutamase
LFVSQEPILFDFALLGHQSYLSDTSQLGFLDQAGFVSRRLGQHRDNPKLSELYMRQADCISMDLGSITGHEMLAVRNPKPFGLKGEEWCQLCWYAGHSPKLRSFGIYGYLAEQDQNGMGAKLVAVGIWHLLEGMANAPHNQTLTQYRVASPGLEDIVFVNQASENLWWVTQQKKNITSLDDGALLFACDESVYQEVLAGEVPQTLVRMMNRLALFDKQVKKAKRARSRQKGKAVNPPE